jgi:predicted transcriptional regulator
MGNAIVISEGPDRPDSWKPDDEKDTFMLMYQKSYAKLFNLISKKKITYSDLGMLLAIAATANYRTGMSQATPKEIAEATGSTETAIKSAISRLKKQSLLVLYTKGMHSSWLVDPFIFAIGGNKVRAVCRLRFRAAVGLSITEEQLRRLDETANPVRRLLRAREEADSRAAAVIEKLIEMSSEEEGEESGDSQSS